MIDLHLHTYFSDGHFSPDEILAGAKAHRLTSIAITDHDNFRAYHACIQQAEAAGIELIPGIEMTTRWSGVGLPPEDENVDLLGYFFDPHHQGFSDFSQELLIDIQLRIADACADLTSKGYPLDVQDLLNENPRYVGAMQAVHAIHAKGYAANSSEAGRLFDTAWHSVREPGFSIQEAIQQVHNAGGLAVLAHPTIVRPKRSRITIDDLRQLVDAGLDGIEIYHRRLNPEDRFYFLALAEKFNLAVTGGSDTHGWVRGLEEMGGQPLPEHVLPELRARSSYTNRSVKEE